METDISALKREMTAFHRMRLELSWQLSSVGQTIAASDPLGVYYDALRMHLEGVEKVTTRFEKAVLAREET